MKSQDKYYELEKTSYSKAVQLQEYDKLSYLKKLSGIIWETLKHYFQLH